MRRWRMWFVVSAPGLWFKAGFVLDFRYQILTFHFGWWELSIGRPKPDWILTRKDYQGKLECETLLLLRRKPN